MNTWNPDTIVQTLTDGIGKAVDTAMQNAITTLKSGGHPAFTPPVANGDDPRSGFTNMGEFALAVRTASHHGGRLDDRLTRLMSKAPTGMGNQVGSDGGFLVPPEFSSKIMQRIYANNSLLGMTDTYTISGNTLTFPRNNESSRANGSRHGGVRGYWMEEGDQITASKPGFGRLQLNLHKIAVLVYVTDELLSDVSGFALDQYLTRVGSDEINFLIGDAIIRGSGAGQPLGILNAPCTVSVAKETSQTAATIRTENVVKMWTRLFAPCRSRAVWFHNQDIESQLFTMSLDVGTGGQVTYLPPGGLSERPYATLMGRPLIPVEWCPTLGTVGDIILADLSQYVTITKGMVETAMSMHLRFDYDEMAFRLIFRLDGQPWWASALTPYLGSNTQSCFITLATRA